jgi:hypothetical protein
MTPRRVGQESPPSPRMWRSHGRRWSGWRVQVCQPFVGAEADHVAVTHRPGDPAEQRPGRGPGRNDDVRALYDPVAEPFDGEGVTAVAACAVAPGVCVPPPMYFTLPCPEGTLKFGDLPQQGIVVERLPFVQRDRARMMGWGPTAGQGSQKPAILEPVSGIEPLTCRLQDGRSAN